MGCILANPAFTYKKNCIYMHQETKYLGYNCLDNGLSLHEHQTYENAD